MGRRHVRIDRGVPALVAAPDMAGDAHALVEHLHRVRSDAGIDLLTGKAIRHRVIMAMDLDVIVDADTPALPVGIGIPRGRQCLERRLVDGLECLPAAAGQFLEGAGIETGQQFADGPIQFIEAETAPVPERGDDPATGDQHAAFDLGFVLGLSDPCRNDGNAVVARPVLIARVEVGFVPVRLLDATLEIVGNDDLGDAAEKLHGPYMRTQPVRQGLCPGGLGKGVVGCAQHGDEQLGRPDFTGVRIDDRQRRASVIDKQLLAGCMGLPHGDGQLADPFPVMLAEGAVAVAIGMLGLVLLPEQVEGDVLPAQLPMDGRPVGFGTFDVARQHGRKQPGLKGGLVQPSRQGIANAGATGTTQVLADRGRAGADDVGNFSLAAPTFVVQPQYFGNLAHG